jgi:DNA-binding transcriptional MerR regulator
LEQVTGITERTISYYNSLGLLSLEKKHGKKMMTDEDLKLLVKIFIMKITHKRLKDIRNIKLEHHPFSDLVIALENMNDQILNLLLCLDRYREELNQRDCFLLLHDLNNYIQKYIS